MYHSVGFILLFFGFFHVSTPLEVLFSYSEARLLDREHYHLKMAPAMESKRREKSTEKTWMNPKINKIMWQSLKNLTSLVGFPKVTFLNVMEVWKNNINFMKPSGNVYGSLAFRGTQLQLTSV